MDEYQRTERNIPLDAKFDLTSYAQHIEVLHKFRSDWLSETSRTFGNTAGPWLVLVHNDMARAPNSNDDADTPEQTNGRSAFGICIRN